jgi:hypothetical protein
LAKGVPNENTGNAKEKGSLKVKAILLQKALLYFDIMCHLLRYATDVYTRQAKFNDRFGVLVKMETLNTPLRNKESAIQWLQATVQDNDIQHSIDSGFIYLQVNDTLNSSLFRFFLASFLDKSISWTIFLPLRISF